MPIPIRALVLFPFTLGEDERENEQILRILKQILDAVQNPYIQLHTSEAPPILFVNRISREKGYFGQAEEYLDLDRDKWEIVHGWSVDTCQDWLYGWGKVIDDWQGQNNRDRLGVLQIPGDLRDVGDLRRFLAQLEQIAAQVMAGCDFVIGDYNLEQAGAKYLIDTYGTLPLLYNWFPDVASKIRTELRIKRPRSEFIAAEVHFLKEMLVNHRRFAYGQTTAFLIHTLFVPGESDQLAEHRHWKVRRVGLGEVQDHTGDRGFREAVDQLERVERMLRLVWRSLHGGDRFDADEYRILDERSAAIRSAAMVTFTNFLQPAGVATPASGKAAELPSLTH